jgi:hypothetical protein
MNPWTRPCAVFPPFALTYHPLARQFTRNKPIKKRGTGGKTARSVGRQRDRWEDKPQMTENAAGNNHPARNTRFDGRRRCWPRADTPAQRPQPRIQPSDCALTWPQLRSSPARPHAEVASSRPVQLRDRGEFPRGGEFAVEFRGQLSTTRKLSTVNHLKRDRIP